MGTEQIKMDKYKQIRMDKLKWINT